MVELVPDGDDPLRSVAQAVESLVDCVAKLPRKHVGFVHMTACLFSLHMIWEGIKLNTGGSASMCSGWHALSMSGARAG